MRWLCALLFIYLPWAVVPPPLCGMNQEAMSMAIVWIDRRNEPFECDWLLVNAAQSQAFYLRGRVGEQLEASMHEGRDGSTPNLRVRATGYRLIEWHGNGNTVESTAYCACDAEDALDALLGSPFHRVHILGEDWFSAHTVYGFGYADGYWVLVIAPPEEISP